MHADCPNVDLHPLVSYTGLQQGIPQQSYPSPEAAWQAAWMEGRRLVQKYQAELTQACPLLL